MVQTMRVSLTMPAYGCEHFIVDQPQVPSHRRYALPASLCVMKDGGPGRRPLTGGHGMQATLRYRMRCCSSCRLWRSTPTMPA